MIGSVEEPTSRTKKFVEPGKPEAFILKKDIVIPAGTILHNFDGHKKWFVNDNYITVIGLTKDSAGDFIYGIDPADPALKEWFEEVPK